ncbi:MAG: Tol-Pal system beta propeller repeat protein TolB [Proteobacteria bacterium]|nr:Tol-Pal system beta propeller repeat protein TolB [Pseudomonadota bacterium]MBU4462974.1 Tol-Pal system beta propeller repeat protein TolB [Pseudomonadota bacterium]
MIFLLAMVCFFTNPAFCRAEHDYIDINNPFLKKIPVAIPLFKIMDKSLSEKRLSAKASNLLSEALEFTGYFKMLDRGAFLVDSEQSDIIPLNINFQNWTSIGAELLITGYLEVKDNMVVIELRLYDTFKSKLLIGKRYKGLINDQRKMIHRFCSDIIHCLTGKRGIFDSKIAFISTGSGNKEIYICEFDGYNPIQKTHNKNITLSPAWSCDGKWIAYTAYKKGRPDLYIEHLKEKRGFIVEKKGINITPAWVPGKFALAATLSFSGDPEIYMLTGTGKIIKKLTNKRGIDVSPSWSPDGKKMAFVSNRSGTPQIYIKDIDSEKVERLTFHGRYNTSPSWSPNGDKIAYCGAEDGAFNIYVIGVDGNDLLQLTFNEGNNESPSWSPDGSLIVFSSNREGSYKIYVMSAYGTDQRCLLALPGEQTNPRWSPSIVSN